MTRQKDNRATFRVVSDHNYLVTLVNLQNTCSGCPRYEATIINTDIEGEYIGSFVYRFTGHYMSREDEAAHIVKYHEKKDALMKAM